MKRTVCIGQGRGDKISFKLLHETDNERLTFLKRTKIIKNLHRGIQGRTLRNSPVGYFSEEPNCRGEAQRSTEKRLCVAL